MTDHPVVSREEWLSARTSFLAKEKEFTRLRDELSRQRRELPWVLVDDPYRIRDAGREAHAGGALRRPAPARRLPLHVQSGVGRGLSALLVLGRQLRRHRRAPAASRCHVPRRSRARRSRRSSDSSSGWGGASRGCRRSAATSTSTTTCRSRRRSASSGDGVLQLRRDDPGPRRPRGRQRVHPRTTTAPSSTRTPCYARGIDILNGAYNFLDLMPKGRDEDGLRRLTGLGPAPRPVRLAPRPWHRHRASTSGGRMVQGVHVAVRTWPSASIVIAQVQRAAFGERPGTSRSWRPTRSERPAGPVRRASAP